MMYNDNPNFSATFAHEVDKDIGFVACCVAGVVLVGVIGWAVYTTIILLATMGVF